MRVRVSFFSQRAIIYVKYFFENNKGYRLSSRLITPDSEGHFACVVFSHGFDSSKDSPRSVPLAEKLAEHGIASFLIDFTGHGESQGLKTDSTIEQQTFDLESALDFAGGLEQVDENRLALHGSSSGSLVALNLCLTDDRPVTAVLRAPRTNSYYPAVREKIEKLTLPLLFIQGELDPLIEQTSEFVSLLRSESLLTMIPGADHLFTDPTHLRQVIDLSVNWFDDKLSMKEAA